MSFITTSSLVFLAAFLTQSLDSDPKQDIIHEMQFHTAESGEKPELFYQFDRRFVLSHFHQLRTIVIAHTICASPDPRISYRQCILIQRYFCAVKNYSESRS